MAYGSKKVTASNDATVWLLLTTPLVLDEQPEVHTAGHIISAPETSHGQASVGLVFLSDIVAVSFK